MLPVSDYQYNNSADAMLTCISAFFRHMPLPKDSPCDPVKGTVIDIDVEWAVIANLLNVIARPEVTMRHSSLDAWQVIELGERYQFEHRPRLMAHSLYPWLSVDPGVENGCALVIDQSSTAAVQRLRGDLFSRYIPGAGLDDVV